MCPRLLDCFASLAMTAAAVAVAVIRTGLADIVAELRASVGSM